MKKLVAILLTLIMALGCVAGLAEEKTEFNIHVLVWKFDDTYGSSVRQGMMKWEEILEDELGVTINLTMDDAQDDMGKQVEQATRIVSQKPDFVIINLADPAGGQVLVDTFTAEGIPFLFYNIPPSEETYESVVKTPGAFFVGTLPREAGDMQGEILADLWAADPAKIDLNGDGTVQFVEFKGVANNPEAIARTQYSEETARELGVPLEMVTDVIVADWDNGKANEAMLSTWQAHPEIELVFANNDDMALGAIAALQAAGYNKNDGGVTIPVFGVDATAAAQEAIAAKSMTGTIKQDAVGMANAVVKIAENLGLGKGTFDDVVGDLEGTWRVNIPYSAYQG